MKELEKIQQLFINEQSPFEVDETIDRIRPRIENCRSKSMDVDVSRLARFALCINSLPLVKILVERHGADLRRRDVLGRSAIFYAAAADDFLIWKYLAIPLPNGSSLEDKD